MEIKLQDVSLKLGEKQIFDGLNFRVKSGEKILVKGPSGSGKSTLLKLIMGFVQPEAGRVMIDGQPLTPKNVWDIRSRIAYVTQELNLGTSTVEDHFKTIFSYRRNQHLQPAESTILDYFDRFYLPPEKYKQSISALSGGEKQRIILIQALLLKREAYLLDEVTSSIDQELRTTVIEHLSGLTTKTMLVISHQEGWEGFRQFAICNEQ